MPIRKNWRAFARGLEPARPVVPMHPRAFALSNAGEAGRNKKPLGSDEPRGQLNAWQCPTFAWEPTLSSALNSFTSEFGMGSGGSRSLWPPGKPKY